MNGSLHEAHKEIKINKTYVVYSIFLIAFIFILIYLSIKVTSLLQGFMTDDGRKELSELLGNWGILGFLSIIGLQIIQIVAAFIPGQFIEFVAGMIYDPVTAIVALTIGLTVATVLIYVLTKWLGKPFVKLFLTKKNESKFAFLKNTKRAEEIFFFIFLLPGIPKDVLIYLAPMTGITLRRFLFISTVARLPGWVLEIGIAQSFVNGEKTLAIVLTIIFVVITLLGIILKKPITRFLENRAAKHSEL